MVRYFCDYCGNEIHDMNDLYRLTSQDPQGVKKMMHFHGRKCYERWYEHAFCNTEEEEEEGTSDDKNRREQYHLGAFEWEIVPYKVTARVTRSITYTQRIIAGCYLYGSTKMAKLLQEKDTTVQNTLTKWGQKSLRSVYRDCLYTTHEIDGMEFDWRKLMTLFASGWTVEKLADEFSCEEEQILRVLEIFTGIKPLR